MEGIASSRARPAEGQPLSAHLYVVDPMGQWMMRFPAEADPNAGARAMQAMMRTRRSISEL